MGKKTISFVATGELAEWIEQEADRRMTTVSTATQQLLAEKYRAEQESDESDEQAEAEQPVSEGAEDDLPEALKRHSDKWWRPESDKHDFAVREPDGGRRYYKTANGAANRLEEYYG